MITTMIFSYGSTDMMEYTPSAATSAGDVAVIGNITGVAHVDIPAGFKAAVCVEGGFYKGPVAAGYAAGIKVYWDATALNLTTATSGNKPFGFTTTLTVNPGDITDVYKAIQ